MGFLNWLKKIFHNVNAHKLAGALAASKTTIDSLGLIEKWDWLPQFDGAATTAINALDSWQPGQSITQIEQALQLCVSILNGVQGLSDKDKAVITIFVDAAETDLALLAGQ